MNARTKIDKAVADLGQAMGMDLKLDENRACRLVFDSNLAVDIDAPSLLPDTLVMTCGLSKGIPLDNREVVYQLLLEANFFARGTGGGVIAYDEDREELVLQHMLAINGVDEQDIVNVLESLLATAESWIDRLATVSSTRSDGTVDGDYIDTANMLSV
jgi:hypothetical protein